MRILVTGANGLIGSKIVEVFTSEGFKTRSFVRVSSDLSLIKNLKSEIFYGDIFERTPLFNAAEGCDLIVHTVADFVYTDSRADQIFEKAKAGVTNVFLAARSAGIKRVVLTSSSVIFGYSHEPKLCNEGKVGTIGTSQYEAMKIHQEKIADVLANENGIELVKVCPTMTVGAYASEIGPSNRFIAAYLNDQLALSYVGGCNVVSSMDVAKAHLIAALHGTSGESYIAGSENLTWVDVHSTISELCGLSNPRFVLGRKSFLMGTLLEMAKAEINQQESRTTLEEAQMIGRYYWYSSVKLAELGYKPDPSRIALAVAISHLVKRPDVIPRETRRRIRLHRDVQALRRLMK
ncbi:MAG: NAD-dependent epimerase/dehydratase family protein [Cyanobacteria bacterium SZAS-4]|nr:NAD-dependent epimerase/dehydratase family protein [Cyanobacteria bacterium SZAS-4]